MEREPRSLVTPALLVLTAALMIAPWTIRNAIVLHRFIPVSDETGITLVGTYNPASAANRPLPYKWRIFYGIPGERPLIRQASRLTEPELGDRLQSQALRYIADHPLAPLAVAYHNTLRLFELEGSTRGTLRRKPWRCRPPSPARRRVQLLGPVPARAGRRVHAPCARAPTWVWLVPLLLALSVVLVNVETPRFREPVDPFLILLAAAGSPRPPAGWPGAYAVRQSGVRLGVRCRLARLSWSKWASAWPEPNATQVSGDSAENTGIPVSSATSSGKPRISVPPPASRIPSGRCRRQARAGSPRACRGSPAGSRAPAP